MTHASPAPCRFGRFELQPQERRLLENGAPVAIAARAYDVLVVLAQRAGQLVTKDELMQRVWSRVIVEDNTLQGQVSILRRILGQDAIATVSGQGYRFELATQAVPGPAVASAPVHNLPHQLTSFVGRERERADLRELMRASRMVTLIGTGGCGKTRLAQEVARDALAQYPDGVWLVELAPLADPSLLPQAVAETLGITEESGRSLPTCIADWLKARRVLILLDNAEHVLVACAQMAESMLRAAPHVAVLATSRQPLDIAGEHTFRVPSLSVPPPEATSPADIATSESAQLFIERARRQRPGFEVTAANAPALAAICRQLDGIPLALELAAPRVRSMSVEEVARRLTRAFKLLTAGSPAVLPRQRTLRSLIDWSYDLLTDREQALLARLSVFAGGFTAEAAEQVCSEDDIERDDMVDTLLSLCDKSLVAADEIAGATRYRLLETVRQYALERLAQTGEEACWRERHFQHVLAFATALAPLLAGRDQKASLAKLDTEHDNLRAALGWSVRGGGDPMAGLTLANAMQRFWRVRQHLTEAAAWLGELLAATQDAPACAAVARAMTNRGVMLWMQSDVRAARALHERSHEIACAIGDRSLVATALGSLVNVAIEEDDYATAKAMQEQMLAERDERDDPHTLATSLGRLGVIYIQLGDMAGARAALEQSVDLCRRLGDAASTALALCNLAVVANVEEDYDTALAFAGEAMATARDVGDPRVQALALNMLGTTSCARGDLATGVSHLRESLVAHRRVGLRYGMTEVCDSLASACRIDRPARAARIWGGIERIRAELGYLKRPYLRAQHARHVAEARAALADHVAFDAAWQSGRALSLDEIVAYVLADA